MCDCCCDCTKLEGALSAMEEKVIEAEGKVSDYRLSLTSQEAYSKVVASEMENLKDKLENVLDIVIDPTTDYNSIWNIIKVACITNPKVALAVLSVGISVVIGWGVMYEGFGVSYITSKGLEEYYQFWLNHWSDKLEERQKKHDELDIKVYDCYSSLINCEACGEEFWEKEECGRDCEGCGRWYCVNCFSERIEEAELAAGEAF